MNRDKLLIIVITLLLLIESCTLFLMYKSLNSKNNRLNVSSKEIVNNNNMFAIMIEQEDGTYKESEENKWPSDGYVFSESMSGCIDENGNKLEGVLSYDNTTNVATVDTTSTSHCYLYFKLTICDLALDSTISAGEYGAKYNCKVDPNKEAYTFYLIANNEDGTSNLIMDANIDDVGEVIIPGLEVLEANNGSITWNDEKDNTYGPVNVISYLYNATKNWTNLEPLNYTYNDREYQGIIDNNIGYESFVSKDGIATITNGDGTTTVIGTTTVPLRTRVPIYTENSIYTSKNEVSNKTTNNSFLYNNIDVNYTYHGPWGYWTMSSSPYDSLYAYFLFYDGIVYTGKITVDSSDGVRPVINVKLK